MIILDATFLVIFLKSNAFPPKDRDDTPVEKFQERVDALISDLNASGQVIGIPTPAFAEVLVKAGSHRLTWVSVLSDRYKFALLPFDSRAAIEASELIEAVKKEQKSQPADTWAKIKFDIQIVSIAKAENATAIYADDIGIERHGKRVRIPVYRVCDLPVPTPPQEPAPRTVEPVSGSQMPLAGLRDDLPEEPE